MSVVLQIRVPVWEPDAVISQKKGQAVNRIWVSVLMAAVMAAGGAFAEKNKTPMDSNSDGKVSKEEFCSAREKMMKNAGREFNRAAVEKQFAAKDKNKGGFLTARS